MTTTQFSRVFNESRMEQGFRDQAHVDAFYAYTDHCHACPICQLPGAPMPLDDGMQPTMQRCDEAQRLFSLLAVGFGVSL